MARDARDVVAGLVRKGFVKTEGDHIFLRLRYKGKKTIVSTKVSRSHKDISNNLISVMSRQVGLNRREFENLIDCDLSYDDYISILLIKGLVANDS